MCCRFPFSIFLVSQSVCCNTCNAVKEAYEKRGWLLTDLEGVEQCAREGVKTLAPAEYDPTEGCNVKGYIEVLKLSGKFHLVRWLAWWAHDLVSRLAFTAPCADCLDVCNDVPFLAQLLTEFSLGFECSHPV